MPQANGYAVGAGLILLVDVLWTSSNFLANTVLTRGYNKPFAVTYLGTASFVTYLIPFLFLYNYDKRRHTDDEPVPWYERLGFRLPPMYPASELPDAKPRTGASLEHSLPSLQAKRPQFPSSIDGRRPRSNLNMRVEVTESAQGRSHPKSYRGRSTTVRNLEECQDLLRTAAPTYVSESQSDLSDANMQVVLASELPPLSIQETAVLAMQFAVVWFAANWSFVAALGYTSVASGTTLGSSSGFFTLLLGGLAGIDSFSPAKLASVFLRYVVNSCSFFGVSLVAWADSGAAHPTGIASHPVLGDSLAIISAMCYAAYVTLLKLRIGSEDRISMPLFLGFVGLFNLVAFWPVGLLLDVLGVEPLELPSDGLMLMGLILNMAITVISDFAYLLAMLKSSPLFTTVGLSLTIPMAALGDAMRDPNSIHMQSGIGSILVLVGHLLTQMSFGAIAWEENWTA